MASSFRLKRKLFAGGFNSGTYNAMAEAARTNATPDAVKAFEGYNKKYAADIANYKNSTALTVMPKNNLPKPTAPGPKGIGTFGKVGIGAAAIGGGYFLGKGLGLWGNNKNNN